MKVFYSHLVVIDDIVSELEAYEMESAERQELITLAEQTLHHHVLNVILSHLPKAKHQTFLDKLELKPEDQDLMALLKKEIEADIESAIKTQADRIKKEILLEIRRSKQT